MAARENETLLHEDRYLKISWIPSDLKEVVLCFTGVGHSLGGLDIQKHEFTGTGIRLGTPVFITDKTRSWGNRIDFVVVEHHLKSIINGRKVIAIGNSMGAFLAIAASKFLPIHTVLAFAPQYSVDPKVVPSETRWKQYRDSIETFTIQSLDGYFVPECRYHIFVGDAEIEKIHWRMIPDQSNINCFIVPETHHDVALTLKSRNQLESAIAQCLKSGDDEALIANAHGFLQRQVPEKN